MTSKPRGALRRAVGLAALILGGCGGALPLTPMDLGSDAPAVLSLSVSVRAPALDGLVVTSGEIELERLGLVGDTTYDERTQIPRITFSVGAPAQQLTFDMASAGIYSRLRAEIDHVEIFATWRGTPLHIQTQSDERVVDIRGPDQALSATASAPFSLDIDGTQWLTASLLDGAPMGPGGIEIDEHETPSLVDDLMTSVTASFTLTAP